MPMPWLAFKTEFRRFRLRAGVAHPLAHMPADTICLKMFQISPVWEEGGSSKAPNKIEKPPKHQVGEEVP